jgi:hypothetical protein
MSGFCDLACDIGTLLHKHAQHEKGRLHVMLSENVEQVKGVGIVGTVIKSKRQLL